MQRPTDWKPSDAQKERLLAFEGYGVDRPDVVFVGLEERCDPDGQRDNVWLRCTHPLFESPRVDKNEACRVLGGVTKVAGVRTWNMMARIMSALTGAPAADELDALGSQPARGHLSTLLTELWPLPRPGTEAKAYHASYIPEWFDFGSKAEYERRGAEITGTRLLRRLRRKEPPRYAFLYGKANCVWAEEHLAGDLRAPLKEVEEHMGIGVTERGTLVAVTGFYTGGIPALSAPGTSRA